MKIWSYNFQFSRYLVVVVVKKGGAGCRTSLDVRMDDAWYDLSGWRRAHPAGEHWKPGRRWQLQICRAFIQHQMRAVYDLIKIDENNRKHIIDTIYDIYICRYAFILFKIS